MLQKPPTKDGDGMGKNARELFYLSPSMCFRTYIYLCTSHDIVVSLKVKLRIKFDKNCVFDDCPR